MPDRYLLICGIVSSLLYAAMNIFIPMLDTAYDPVSQTVSELSAIGAPTRTVWVLMGSLYSMLVIAFGWGVRRVAGANRLLYFAGLASRTRSTSSGRW
jgi:hypothetical protein